MTLAKRSLVVWAFAVVVLFAWLGARGLNEPDEGRYAEIAREMLVSGDWLMPRLNGIEHVQKPPLLYWVTALSFATFGYDETAARLVSAAAALGTLLLVAFLSGSLFPQQDRQLPVLILLSTTEFVLLSRTLTPDMVLTFWVTAAISSLVMYVWGGRRPMWRLGFFAAMGLGFLTKGPMAFVVPVSAALLLQRALKQRGDSVRLRWPSGFLITLLLGGWWFVALAVEHPSLVDYFLAHEIRDRLFSNAHGRRQPVWFFLPVLLGGTVPWTPVLCASAMSAARRLRASAPLSPAAALLLGWIVPPLLALSLGTSKLATYVLPLFPALALVMARWCAIHADCREGRRAVTASVALALVVCIALPAAVLVARALLPGYEIVGFSPGFTLFASLSLVIFGLLLRFLVGGGSTSLAVPRLAGVAALLWVGLVMQADRLLMEDGGSLRPLARIIAATPGAEHAQLFALNVRGHGLEFYLHRLVSRTENQSDIVLSLSDEQERRVIRDVDSFLASVEAIPAIGIVNPRLFRRDGPFARWRVLGRAGRYVLVANRALLDAPGNRRPGIRRSQRTVQHVLARPTDPPRMPRSDRAPDSAVGPITVASVLRRFVASSRGGSPGMA